ncbi:acylphosphatase [Rhizobiaceae bacterium n13]|uniref:acylphosphatase n=1 Tax=Ferirhizobium litorale TaxID=2927786 RepID=A0AAE3QJG8_9HYPH|nr:acylphosphatase [Fererhizobium litorale]MDI7864915.1 acylphosphatase [Fererhizobium litorale]MDI7925035.1 acylphosphatase [Fererhizobium litorale]
MAENFQAVEVRVRGRVQGVSYRVWTRDQAERLGLTGWVRNDDDGSVVVMIAGPGTALSTMIDRCWHGPPGASVSAVETRLAAIEEKPTAFRITR